MAAVVAVQAELVKPVEHVLVVPGDPVPWAPKQTNRKTGNRFISPRQEEAIGRVLAAVERAELADTFSADQAVILSAVFHVKRPKGHYGSGRNAGVIKEQWQGRRPTGRPDLSNLVKLVEDAMVLGGVLPDDDQIVGFYPPFGKVFTQSREEQPHSVIRMKVATSPCSPRASPPAAA